MPRTVLAGLRKTLWGSTLEGKKYNQSKVDGFPEEGPRPFVLVFVCLIV